MNVEVSDRLRHRTSNPGGTFGEHRIKKSTSFSHFPGIFERGRVEKGD